VRKTKIVCTIGPASDSLEMMKKDDRSWYGCGSLKFFLTVLMRNMRHASRDCARQWKKPAKVLP